MQNSCGRPAFHTVLSDGTRPDIVASEEERRLVEQHVGRFIITWGQLDLTLSMTVAAMSDPTRPGLLQANFIEMATYSKIGFLRSLLPKSWQDGQHLLELLTLGNKYRNDLAHPVLGMSGTHNGREYAWHLWKPQKGSAFSLDAPQMLDQERDASIAREALLVLMRNEYIKASTVTDFEAHPLGPAVLSQPGTWPTEEAYRAFCDRVRTIFT
ncbi:MAG: hypothetical protein ABI400_06730 [Lacisediminihabitans sp.]